MGLRREARAKTKGVLAPDPYFPDPSLPHGRDPLAQVLGQCFGVLV